MIVRSIRLEGFGCFANPVTVGPLGPGVNILHAPNGTGKTTIFRGMSMALLEGHRAKSADVQAWRPWARRLTPHVAVEFEHAGREYRIRKRFLDGASALLETREGDNWTAFAQNDEADAFLRELLNSDPAKARAAKPEHWGIAQVLWTTQGDLALPELAGDVVESIRKSIGAQLGSTGSAVEDRVEQEYLKFYSPERGTLRSGRNGAPQLALQKERDRIAGELQTAEELLRAFEAESARVEQIRKQAATYGTQREAIATELKSIREAAEVYCKLENQRKERQARKQAAASQYENARSRIEAIARCRAEVTSIEAELDAIATKIPDAAAALERERVQVAEAEAKLTTALAAEQQARDAATIAQFAQDFVRLTEQRGEIARRLTAVSAASAQLLTVTNERAGINAPSNTERRELRRALDGATQARNRLELARVTVRLTPSTSLNLDIAAGECPGICQAGPGEQVTLAGAPNLTFAIGGIGAFEVSGPATDYDSIRKERERHEAVLATYARRFGTSDLELLDARNASAAAAETRIRELNAELCALLGGDTEEQLRCRDSQIATKIAQSVAAHPEWGETAPDAEALSRAAKCMQDAAAAQRDAANGAAAAARTAFAAAERALHSLEEQQKTRQRSLESARSLLAHNTQDGLSDEHRRAALNAAALEYDACVLALENVEQDLRAFPEDPTLRAERVAKQLEDAERRGRDAENELVRAETRIEQLAARRPYAAYAEASEQRAVKEAALAREQRRMKALALLRNTLAAAKSDLMSAVAEPVQEAATAYLQEICGKPVAAIRLSQEFAAEQVVPAALAGHAGEEVALERLSGGEREQIFLCTRLALALQLGQSERHMLVLDDVLTFTDAERLNRICALLNRLSDKVQLVILTCHPERFASLKNANRIDLETVVAEPAHA